MKIFKNFLGVIPFLVCLDALSANSALDLKNRGKKIGEISLSQIKAESISKKITVYEPHEKKKVSYEAISVKELFNKIYGKQWERAEEVLFTCSDGYQPSIPVSEFKKYDAYFAFRRENMKKFTLNNKLQEEKEIKLGPFYLIWDNIKHSQLKEKGASSWPYQVISIDLIRFKDKFPKMAPHKNRSHDVTEGFLLYRTHCMSCHSVNGEGGDKAAELNYPVNITEYFDEKWLKKWIDNPNKVRLRSQMPPFQYTGKNRKKAIDQIVTYLKAMKKNKIKP